MNLLDSLLDAIVRLDGDALVMHVGEKPYVVTTTSAMNEHRGPLLWGQVDLSTRLLSSEAVLGMLAQIMPLDQRQALDEFGAVEHHLDIERSNARFSVIAARAGDDVWLEVRKRPKEMPVAVAQPIVDEPVVVAEASTAPQPAATVEAAIEPPVERPVEEVIAEPIDPPAHVPEAAHADQRPAIVESPAAVLNGEEIEDEPAFNEPLRPFGIDREKAETPFEIVHDVNQDAPSDADVDELLAASAAALLRTAAPTVAPEPVDAAHGQWLELEERSEAVASKSGSEPVLSIAAEPDLVPPPPVAPEPITLASQTESIAIAPELEGLAIAREPVSPIADVELHAEADFEAVACDDDVRIPSAVLASSASSPFAPVQDEEIYANLPEPLIEMPEPELVLVGAAATFEPVAYADEFRLVAPTADTLMRQGFAAEPDPEPMPVFWDEGPDLFAFVEHVDSHMDPTDADVASEPSTTFVPEPVAILEPEPTPSGVAIGAQPEETVAETEPPPTCMESEPAAAVELDDVHEDPELIAAVSGSAPITAHAVHESPIMASVRPPQSGSEPERGIVVPLDRRPHRPDLSPAPTAALPAEFSIDELLRAAAARGASTVYLVTQSRPMVRAEGDINVLDIGTATPLQESDIARLLNSAPQPAREAWERGASAEWIVDIAEVGRVRCMTFRDHRGPGLIFRMIPPQAISADHLGLTPEVQALCTQSDGLVLVTGPRAGVKSTLMSGFVDLINRTRSDHVITIEPQIEFVHESRRSFVSQREVRAGDESMVAAVRSALREDPDVLFIGEVSSADVVAVALEAAESGRLVFASLPAPSTVAAVDRLLELLPADRSHGRASLAASLRGVVAEVLVGRTRGGRVPAREVLLNTAAVADLIEDAKTDQLPLAIENGRRHGMMPLNDVLISLLRDGTVHVAEAYRRAFDKESLLAALRQEGVDTSFAEKIA